MERLERQQTQLELDADAKPVKAIPQHVLDVVLDVVVLLRTDE